MYQIFRKMYQIFRKLKKNEKKHVMSNAVETSVDFLRAAPPIAPLHWGLITLNPADFLNFFVWTVLTNWK